MIPSRAYLASVALLIPSSAATSAVVIRERFGTSARYVSSEAGADHLHRMHSVDALYDSFVLYVMSDSGLPSTW